MCPSKLRASKKVANVHCATVSFASAAVISPNLVHGPHFGKDDGATVEAVGELYLEKVSASITYTVKVLDTPVPVRIAGCNDSSEASGAVVYATHSVTLDDVIFGDRLESITFLILPQSSIPFLFSKALAQWLSVKMDYKDNVMVIPSPSGPDIRSTSGSITASLSSKMTIPHLCWWAQMSPTTNVPPWRMILMSRRTRSITLPPFILFLLLYARPPLLLPPLLYTRLQRALRVSGFLCLRERHLRECVLVCLEERHLRACACLCLRRRRLSPLERELRD
uniref:Uncharacterized protein n=1 Tax=Chromera velia CCMP2878 TaxID=1169474 RepID=A0A0G4G5Z7_9ALVE|eukprot:Cvel_20379.t1-p1 / transcript=Cvel_20379.t1 / gene=Cvel_20379 / organism=Chromera_velia_CCMP2878 / gene_product=hypothetical protein / transcript_product=hypothetical protein / location=Cvel_scaffold1824:6948-7784(+) / protein_length=279 / sequence_SO=supercontig / SO=protein_coding / is_pseudo=false